MPALSVRHFLALFTSFLLVIAVSGMLPDSVLAGNFWQETEEAESSEQEESETKPGEQ